MSDNPLYRYDFTSFSDAIDDPSMIDRVKNILQAHCKQWGFQLEKCPSTGNLHWQGRFSLNKKARKTSIPFKLGHYSITAVGDKNDYEYVTKIDTRIAGPWTYKDEVIYVPKQVRDIKLLPWQQQVVDSFKIWDTRSINIIYCPHGNIGKSTLTTYVRAHKLAVPLPPINDMKDMLRVVYARAQNSNNAFIIDMPRAMKKDKLYGMYSGMETIKDGYAYDDRYEFREKVFDCPVIWVFTNTFPDTSMLSEDRWKFWEVDDSNLIPYSFAIDS